MDMKHRGECAKIKIFSLCGPFNFVRVIPSHGMEIGLPVVSISTLMEQWQKDLQCQLKGLVSAR